MSVKRIREEYEQICDQYHEMMENLRELEKELAEEIIPPEFVDNMKAQISPIKDRYEQWAYFMFLLNEPQRVQKREKYRKMIDKKIKQLKLDPKNSPEYRAEEANQALRGLKEMRK